MIAEDLMAEDPFRVTLDTSIREADELMRENGLRHLPVVDDEGVLTGILSDRDIRAYMPWAAAGEEPSIESMDRADDPVSAAMQNDPFCVTPEASADEMIGLMITHKVGAVPVAEVGTDRLVGIVSYIDILRAARGLLG